jgi:hypothetical protein
VDFKIELELSDGTQLTIGLDTPLAAEVVFAALSDYARKQSMSPPIMRSREWKLEKTY